MLIVIIPTFQAQAGLSQLLPQLVGERIVVADGGSTDETLPMAVASGAVLAVGATGRGAQLRLGAKLATLTGEPGDWFLFLHADSQLPKTWTSVVETAMVEGEPRYFRFKAAATGVRAWLMNQLVALRCATLGLPYGDQGLLIPRTLYEQIGGYAPMALFEDVDLVERLSKVSSLRPLPAELTTDVSAHWRDGLWARGTRNLGLLWRYKRGVTVDELLRAYR
ncbi:glycosyl transferase [Algimonas ampicilliniresistens]|uniref:Glycosyl transferase n=1 Tax=Algimonas ampicilliniresistens TaxID=1298735 RepID=A0ABQ5V6M9_9PROT|nr:glycosyltransferase [Algimonas ampicilliniresistens]GLQ22735.1 glycosyl transferase [Algimonas ampicilliniresistens]